MVLAEDLLLAEALDDGQGEGDGLARAGAVAGDEVLTLVDELEGLVLDWEEFLYPFLGQNF